MLYVALKASKVALQKFCVVLVSPKVLLQISDTPANSRTLLATSPITNPNPFGAGFRTTLTLPIFPSTSNGIEWGLLHVHSQLPQPLFTGIMFNFERIIAFRIAVPTPAALAWATPTIPFLFPTPTISGRGPSSYLGSDVDLSHMFREFKVPSLKQLLGG